ncbi:MAG: tetratricopeptide repeat protein [Methanotrichaceae archaeon]|nr:tetratricopeptide repeat protein [Methanotrichaceae archaeon]
MDQLIVLQSIYDSFLKGKESLPSIDKSSIDGNCSSLVIKLLSEFRQGIIDQNICQALSDCLQDSYELKRLGDICRKAKYFDLAIKCYDRALVSCRDQTVSPILLNNLGQVYTRAGDQIKAISYFLKAVDGFETIGDLSGAAHVMGNLASTYRRNREWDKAMEYSIRSLQTFEGVGDEFGVAQMMGSLGRIYSETGKNDIAESYFKNSLKEFKRLGDKRSAALVLDRLGRIYVQTGRWDEAIAHFNKGITLFEELRYDQGLIMVLSDIGRMYLEKGDAGAALDILKRAERLVKRDMQPAYQNYIALMAASNGLLAKVCMQEAEKKKLIASNELKEFNVDQKLKLASQYFSKASDLYQELASTPKIQIPELGVSAGVSKSFSNIALMACSISDEKAIELAQRAIYDFEVASTNSQFYERKKIETTQSILKGMREAWSVNLTGREVGRLAESISNSIEYLNGPASQTGGVNRHLSGALHNLSVAITEERNRGDPSRYLEAVASQLRLAAKQFMAYPIERLDSSVLQVEEAAKLIDDLTTIKIDPSVTIYRGSSSLNYRTYKSALIAIGWAMLLNDLSEQDFTGRTFAWDEGLNLVDVRSFKSRIENRDIEIDTNRNAFSGATTKQYVPREPAYMLTSIKNEDGRSSWSGSSFNKQNDYYPNEDVHAGQSKNYGTRAKIAESFQSIADLQKEQQMKATQPSNGSKRIAGGDLAQDRWHRISSSSFTEPDRGIFARESGIKLVKAQTLLVLMLLAVDITLYLI